MVHAAAAHSGYVLKAAADPHAGPREAFARDHNARAYAGAEELMADPEVQAVYIATPHQFHAPHAVLAAEHGKHIILEKPMALTLADCDAIIAAVERHKVHLVVGHTHAFDPNVRLMRDIIARGELGRLGLINSFNYTNFLYRPRRPEELDTVKGRRHPVQPGAAPDRHRAALGRRHRQKRAGAGERARSVAADRRKLRGASAIRKRRRGLAGLQRLRPFRFRRMAFRHRRARRAEAHRPWRGPPRAGAKPRMRQRRAPKPLPTATPQRPAAAPAAFRHHHRDLCGWRHARLGRWRHASTAATACATSRSRAAAACRAAARCWTTWRRRSAPAASRCMTAAGARPRVEVALAILRSSRENREVMLEHQVAVDASPR